MVIISHFCGLCGLGCTENQNCSTGDGIRTICRGTTPWGCPWGWKFSITSGKTRGKMRTRLNLPDVSCAEGRPLEDHIHLLNTHRTEKRCHSLVRENRERKQMWSRFTHWHTSQNTCHMTAIQQFLRPLSFVYLLASLVPVPIYMPAKMSMHLILIWLF